MKPNLTIIFEPGEDGWWVATIPEVQGVVSQGRTKQEAREMVLDALDQILAVRRERAIRLQSPLAEVEAFPPDLTPTLP